MGGRLRAPGIGSRSSWATAPRGAGAVAAVVVVAASLACAGGTSVPEPRGAEVPDAPPIRPAPAPGNVPVPSIAAPFLPEGTDANAADPTIDPVRVSIDGTLEPLRDRWTDGVELLGSSTDRIVGARWVQDRVVVAIAVQSAAGVDVAVHRTVPDVGLDRGRCADGQWEVAAGWPEGGKVVTCVRADGPGLPVGPFRVERGGVTVIDGGFTESARRTGVWTIRTDDDEVVATGAYQDGVPIGGWTFSSGGVEHQVLYVDGYPQDLPFAQLPTGGTDPRPWTTASFEILDANLEGGAVAAALHYTIADAMDCPAAGRVDPKAGFALALLAPGHRDPIGRWTVYEAAGPGTPCTTEDAAAAALAAANTAFAERGLDPTRRPALVAPAGSARPFDKPGVLLEVGGHAITIRPPPIDPDSTPAGTDGLPLEAQLQMPDLIAGTWVTTDAQQVRSATVSIDDQPLEDVWIRWPTECAGGATVDGALWADPWLSVVYRSAACTGGGPIWTLGPPLRVGAPEGDGLDELPAPSPGAGASPAPPP
ncbi:MAG: hypothetical protein ABMB14_03540 [Myxococcota bacterium]